MEFPEQLKALRNKAGKTQMVMSGLIGISMNYYQALEQGRSHPSKGMLKRIADAIKVPVSYFSSTAVTNQEPQKPPKPETKINPPAVKPIRFRTNDGYTCQEKKCGWRVCVGDGVFFCPSPRGGCMKAFEQGRNEPRR